MNQESTTYYSHGKLLLTAEYLVLDGALALALPTKFGQTLTIETIDEPKLKWQSISNEGAIWFEEEFEIEDNKILKQSRKLSGQDDNHVAKRLLDIFYAVKTLNPNFLKTTQGFKATSSLEFPQNWGLGSSSTLISNIANWAHVDTYKLLELTFGGSGYDIACAQNSTAITYQLKNKKPFVQPLDFNPSFKEHLYFVHLNKKQDSREGIAHYKSNNNNLDANILEINSITKRMIACQSLLEFEALIEQHESIIGKCIQLEPIKERLFKDFKGAVKSLGAWGGDFVLVASKHNPRDYFKSKGFKTILTYAEMILN